MPRLSVNINKIATIRNARGENNPDIVSVAQDCERFGAQGITVHPRPDERHIRYRDVVDLKRVVTTELNVEGYPDQRFMQLIEEVVPTQVTLVPDPPNLITSNAGWDTVDCRKLLTDMVATLKKMGVQRVSLFVEPSEKMIEGAFKTGAERIELFTGHYATMYDNNPTKAVNPYKISAHKAQHLGMKVNAGHDLNAHNIGFFVKTVTPLEEVSVGHALICDALYFGLENTIHRYRNLCHLLSFNREEGSR